MYDDQLLGGELILQNEKIVFSNGLTARIQFSANTCRIRLYLNTDAYSYEDRILNMSKRGISVKSNLKVKSRRYHDEIVEITRSMNSIEDFKEKTITIEDRYFKCTIILKMSEIARKEVLNQIKRYFDEKEEV